MPLYAITIRRGDFSENIPQTVLRDHQEHTRDRVDSVILHVEDRHSFDVEGVEKSLLVRGTEDVAAPGI